MNEQHIRRETTIDAEDLGAFSRALRVVFGEELERDAKVLFHRPEIGGAPVELEAKLPEAGLEITLERIGEPPKGYLACRTLRLVLEGERAVTERSMRELLSTFEEERRMDCRGAEHFLGNPKDFTWHELRVPAVLLASVHELLDEELPGFHVAGIAKPRNSKGIVKASVLDARGREVAVYTDVRSYRRSGDSWLVVEVEANGGFVRVALAATGVDHAWPMEVLRRIERRLDSGYGLVERVMSPNGEALRLDRKYAWDELYLEPATKALLEEETMGFFDSAAAYAKMKVPHRRGVLLYGPPGTGKTLVGRILASSLARCVFIWVTAKDVEGPGSIAAIFATARRAERVVLFFEDLDLYAAARQRYMGGGHALGELLVQLDGMRSNAGMLVIATTNDLDAIEPALKDRPSRFDRRVELRPSGQSVRAAHLAHLLGDYGVEPEAIAVAARKAEGYTGAQIQELAFRARMAAARAGRDRVGRVELDLALEEARTYRAPVVGFRSDEDDD